MEKQQLDGDRILLLRGLLTAADADLVWVVDARGQVVAKMDVNEE